MFNFFFLKKKSKPSVLFALGHAQQEKVGNRTLAVLSKGTGVLTNAEWLIIHPATHN